MTEKYLKITRNDYIKLIEKGWNEKRIIKKFGFDEVVVTYADNSEKEFILINWLIFRDQIVKNLYLKGLCEIDFYLNNEKL